MSAAAVLGGCEWFDGVDVEVEFTMHAERFDLATAEFSPAPAPTIERNLFDWIAADDGLLLIGGFNEDGGFSDAVEHYDPLTQTWTRRSPWPDPGLAWSVWVGDRLCTLGGYDDIEADVRSVVWCYDPPSDSWTQAASLPRRYSSFYPTVYDGKIWIPGGTEVDSNSLVEPIDELWAYDPATDAWTQHASLPAPRGLAAVHTLGDHLYMLGGWDDDSLADLDDTPEEAEMLVYEPATDSWTLAPQMPNARFLFGSRVVGDELVVYFGATEGPLVEIYDPATQTWRAGTEPAEPLDAGVYSSALDGDRLYMLVLVDGSEGGKSVSSGKLWAYDLSDDEWSIVGERDPSREDALFYGAVWGGAIHWVGAFTSFDYEFEQDQERSAAWPGLEPRRIAPRSPARRGVVLERR